ncbi:MAG: tetratricopeptide repeat protein [Bacteroidetes bacterium]|nr:tetratricopeptide repeat protein [Bacteroidota bacterium]
MKRKSLTAAVICLILVLLSGCATSIAFDVIKPAEINMSEYSHLAIFDIEPYEFSFLDLAGTVVLDLILGKDIDRPTGYTLFMEKDISNKFERQLIYSLQQADYFTLIPPSQLRPYKNINASGAYSNDILINNFNVTASLIGTIEDMRFHEEIIEIETNVDDGFGGVITIITESFLQEVTMDFSYSILDLRTNQIIATRYEKGERRLVTQIEDKETFRPPKLYDLYTAIITEISSKIRYQLAPRIEREYRFLEKDKTRNRVMETADKLVKDRNYEQALSLYLEIWYSSRNYAAGYNAAVLYEVMGQLQQAVSFMQDVANRTKNPDAYRKLSQLEHELQVYNEAITQIRQ